MDASIWTSLMIGALIGFGFGWLQKWHTDRRLELHGVKLKDWDTKAITAEAAPPPVTQTAPELVGRMVTQ